MYSHLVKYLFFCTLFGLSIWNQAKAQTMVIPPERVAPFFIELFEWERGDINTQHVVALDASYISISANYSRSHQHMLVEIEDVSVHPRKVENFIEEYTLYSEMHPDDRPLIVRTFQGQDALVSLDENRGMIHLRFLVEDRFMVQFMMTGSPNKEMLQEFNYIIAEFPVDYLVFVATYVHDPEDRSTRVNSPDN